MARLLPARLLGGVPLQVAECYGKPHIGCRYEVAEFPDTRQGRAVAVNSHRLDEGALCACCGRPATNAHHWPPKRNSPTFHLNGHCLRPALFAVCGSGTTGCHNGWHAGARYRAIWKWDADEYFTAWWFDDLVGETGAHSNELYLYGCWELYDMLMGRIWEVRPS